MDDYLEMPSCFDARGSSAHCKHIVSECLPAGCKYVFGFRIVKAKDHGNTAIQHSNTRKDAFSWPLPLSYVGQIEEEVPRWPQGEDFFVEALKQAETQAY